MVVFLRMTGSISKKYFILSKRPTNKTSTYNFGCNIYWSQHTLQTKKFLCRPIKGHSLSIFWDPANQNQRQPRACATPLAKSTGTPFFHFPIKAPPHCQKLPIMSASCQTRHRFVISGKVGDKTGFYLACCNLKHHRKSITSMEQKVFK